MAPFRNPSKPLPGAPVIEVGAKQVTLVQGHAEAIVCATGTADNQSYPNLLQYLSRDESDPSQWTLQPFAGGYALSNTAVVAAITDQAAPQNVNFFWLDNDNVMWWSWMTGTSEVFVYPEPPTLPTSSTVPSKYKPSTWNVELANIHVAYTPAPSMNPVVYAAQGGNGLVTLQWGAGGNAGWTTTAYDTIGKGGNPGCLNYYDLVLVPQSETSFLLFANQTGSNDISVWTGTFGEPGSLDHGGQFNSNPSLSGSAALKQLVAGAAEPSGGGPCVYYIDSDDNLLMWPSSLPPRTLVPVPNTGTPWAASVASASGAGCDLYSTDASGNVWLSHQLMWADTGQLPFFAPPSLVAGGLNAPGPIAPLSMPAELPAVFAVDSSGALHLYETGAGNGNVEYGGNQVTYAANQWQGGQIDPVGASLAIDTKSYY